MNERKSGRLAFMFGAVLLTISLPVEAGYAKPAFKLTVSGAMGKGKEAVDVPWSVIYHDGSANGFRFWKDSSAESARFEYSPVKPEESSTGRYSGGEERKGKMKDGSALQLWRWIRRLESDTSLHTKARNKGTGAFVVKESSGDQRDFIIEDGPLLREFNQFLARFR